jgi:uncharacterized damage-inducible protein DinB
MSQVLILVELFRHNLWANLRLIEVCSALMDEQLNTSVMGTYGSIRDTLLHIVRSEERYVALLAGHDPPAPHESFPAFGELQERARKSGEALVSLAGSLDGGRVLQGTWRGNPYSLPVFIPLIQAINHATEHRSQIATVLTQLGIQPPELDGWAYHYEQMVKTTSDTSYN